MTTSTEPDLVRVTAVEVLDAVRQGRIRFPNRVEVSATYMVTVLDGLRPGFPVQRVLVWRDPDAVEVGHLLDGADLVQALRRLADGAVGDHEPAYLDTDTGEFVVWGQRPDRSHVLVELGPRFLGEAGPIVEAERLSGTRAEHVRATVDLLRADRVLLETLHLPRARLARVLDRLAPGGTALSDLDLDVPTQRNPSASGWSNDPESLIDSTEIADGVDLSVLTAWRGLLAAEGRSTETGFEPSPDLTADFADDGRAAVRAVRRAAVALHTPGGFPLRHNPVREPAVIVARLFGLFPDLDLSSIGSLIRRWAWRAALSGLDRASTPALLPLVHGDAPGSVVRLLDALPAHDPSGPGRDPLDLGSTRRGLVLLGMADLHPRDLQSGDLVDIDDMPVTEILPERPSEAANLLIHAPARAERSVHDLLVDPATDPTWLASHGIDGPAAASLRAGDPDAFLARRAELLDRAVRAFWNRMAEPVAPNRVPLDLLFAADPDEDQDEDQDQDQDEDEDEDDG